jgi:hypothetical protein
MNIGRVLARMTIGPGSPSIDDTLGLDLKGGGWALAALAAGVAGSTAAIELARRAAAEQEDVSTPSGRFERAAEGVEQDVPAKNPA